MNHTILKDICSASIAHCQFLKTRITINREGINERQIDRPKIVFRLAKWYSSKVLNLSPITINWEGSNERQIDRPKIVFRLAKWYSRKILKLSPESRAYLRQLFDDSMP